MSYSLWCCINAHMVLIWKCVDEILKYDHSKASLFANRWVTDLRVARAMHDFQEQCQTVFHEMVCLSLFLQILA